MIVAMNEDHLKYTMDVRFWLLISAILIFAAPYAHAAAPSAGSSGPFAANFVGAGLTPLSFPLVPFSAGKWDVSISPAFVTFKTFNNQGNMDDFKQGSAAGAAGSVVAGLTDHFALGFTGLGFSGHGTYTTPAGGLINSGSPVNTSGEIVALSAIWDYFSGDGFRLPIMFGINYESMHDKTTNVVGPAGTYGTLRNDLDSLGIQGGFSVQFNTGVLRWEPFAMVYFPFNNEKQSQNGGVYDSSIHSDTGGPQPGINVVYRPWNLSFFYALGMNKARGTSVYSLRWAKSFGGSN